MPRVGSGNNAGNESYSNAGATTLWVNSQGISSTGVSFSEIATSIHKHGPDALEKLENGKCHKIFNNDFVPDYSSVILMTNTTIATNSLLAMDVHWSTARDESVEWFSDTIDTEHWYLIYHDHITKDGSQEYSYALANGTIVYDYRDLGGPPSSTAIATVEYRLGQKVTPYLLCRTVSWFALDGDLLQSC